MRLDEQFKRRVRIEGKSDDVRGNRLHVCDVETGEVIDYVRGATVYLHAERDSYAELIYAVADAKGRPLVRRGNIVEQTIRVDNPEISLTAWEGFNPDE